MIKQVFKLSPETRHLAFKWIKCSLNIGCLYFTSTYLLFICFLGKNECFSLFSGLFYQPCSNIVQTSSNLRTPKCQPLLFGVFLSLPKFQISRSEKEGHLPIKAASFYLCCTPQQSPLSTLTLFPFYCSSLCSNSVLWKLYFLQSQILQFIFSLTISKCHQEF